MRVGDSEVGGEHRGGNFPTVSTVADKGVNQARAFGWLGGIETQGRKGKFSNADLQMPVGRRRRSM
jgi:hypothetical protein